MVGDGSPSVGTKKLSCHLMYLYNIYFVPTVCRVLRKALETQNNTAKTHPKSPLPPPIVSNTIMSGLKGRSEAWKGMEGETSVVLISYMPLIIVIPKSWKTETLRADRE